MGKKRAERVAALLSGPLRARPFYVFSHLLFESPLLANHGISIDELIGRHTCRAGAWHRSKMSLTQSYTHNMLEGKEVCSLKILRSAEH